MLELIELRFKGIGRFVDEQVVDVATLQEFVQVDGQNNNTGGSSGSGKTTIFNALDYLLGLNNLPATILQSRFTKDLIWVQGKYLLDGDPIKITRSKSTFEIECEAWTKTASQAEEELDKILGMPRDLFRKIIHKRQDEGGFFIEFTPKLMHGFLMDCTNLTPFKAKYEIVEKELTQHEKSIQTYQTDLAAAKAGLSATQDAILALGLAPIQDIHKEVILELKERYDKSAIRFANVEQKCESMDREFAQNRPDIADSTHDGTVGEALEKRRREIEEEIRASQESERFRQEGVKGQITERSIRRGGVLARIDKGRTAQTKAAEIAGSIKSIRSQKCPTCLQDWASTDSVAHEQAHLAELINIKEIIADGIRAGEELKVLDQDLDALKSRLTPAKCPQGLIEEFAKVTQQVEDEKRKAREAYDKHSSEMKAQLDVFAKNQADFRKQLGLQIDQARSQMDVDRRVLDMAVQKLKSYEEAKNRYDQTFNGLKQKEAIFTKKVADCNSDLEDTIKYQNFALESKKAIKMYVSRSFDEALDAISEKATKIIRCIPNMSNATIQFEGTRETGKGVVKEEVNAVISMDGEVGIPIKSLSGGERSALDLAIDLAVIDYIETKTGKGLNLFILDEPFRGLGTVEIEMALEVLKNANTNKKLVLTDHNPEVKEMVQSRLIVIRDGLTSVVTQS